MHMHIQQHAPTDSLYLPGTQAVHVASNSVYPASHLQSLAEFEAAAEFEFTGQFSHVSQLTALTVKEYLPASQSWHSLSLAPLYLPASQVAHSLFCVFLYIPSGQVHASRLVLPAGDMVGDGQLLHPKLSAEFIEYSFAGHV